ncbi:putative inner membrane protein [Rosistilla carotiformis]|uniref:Putative inner membrane protein n=1 Tax=Rosistilla carotiformis TaxID=2528017 RepID=A0A518JVJ2_9BACT|nr:AI-2E family transporter [Rosistilla carotiformis]QDV69564.1 putative inner membrane protein [Rosistilla carotiformis]
MPRHFSFWLLIGLIGLFGLLFFHVIKPFVLALFVAIVLTVLFAPMHESLTRGLSGHNRIAAALTTALVLVVVLLPICVTLIMAGNQVTQLGRDAVGWFDGQSEEALDETIEKLEKSKLGSALNQAYRQLDPPQRDRIKESISGIADGATVELYDKTRGLISNLVTFGVSLCIMALALYYFLADRELFTHELHRMMPLETEEEKRLSEQFHCVCRGVVMGTVVAGVVQAALAGLAFAILGVPNVWVLMVLTMFCSFIPFIGSAAVWGSVAAWLLFEGDYGRGIGLAAYGAAIVSTSDNLVRAYVIGNQAKLHPLVALVTVLGALKLMGLWGIFVGPMLAAVLYALLNIARDRFDRSQPPVADHNID